MKSFVIVVVTQHSKRRCRTSTARTSPLKRFTVDSTPFNSPMLEILMPNVNVDPTAESGPDGEQRKGNSVGNGYLHS